MTDLLPEHIIAAAVHANGGRLEFTIDDLLADENYGKYIKVEAEDGNVVVTLIDELEES
jgi:hypothetical protein